MGLSVSRVGGDAQTKAMKKAAGAIRLDLAQYREMEVFTQFSSDLDDTTKRQLTYGQGLMRLLRQNQYQPLCQHQQIITLIAAMGHVMQNIPLEQIKQFQSLLLRNIEEQLPDICGKIDSCGEMSEEERAAILSLSREFLEHWQEKRGE